MRLISTLFETPVVEDWDWLTDVIVSDNGTEQRIQLLDPPRRSLRVTYQTATDEDTRRMMRDMFAMQLGLLVPAYHQATKIAPAAIGDALVSLNPARTELRDGCDAIVFDRGTGAFERVTIVKVNAATATLTAGLKAAWGRRASIAPLWAMSAADNAAITRGRVNATASVSLSMAQLTFVDPFLNPFNATVLDTFAGLPLLLWNAVGDDFSQTFSTGATLIDYGGVTEIRSRWKHTQQEFGRTFLCQRILKRSRWDWWRTFADYCKGSAHPFYMPTFRPDFGIVGVAANNTMMLKGTDYAELYWPNRAFKQFAIFTGAGVHYASVTAVAEAGGNTVCTFDPPLPNDAGYAINQAASLLLKCRISDDKVSCSHTALETNITINMRTVDE